MLRKTILFLIFLSFFISINAQDSEFEAVTPDYKYLIYIADHPEPFYYGDHLVTNREYISYLIWLRNVYSEHPEKFWKAFPGIKEIPDIAFNKFNKFFLDSLLNTLDSKVGEYIFNPKFIDSPITGITYNQTISYLHWMTDRVNEYILIRNTLLMRDPDQINEESFSTESYLNGQYIGLTNHELLYLAFLTSRPVIWEDQLLMPAIRLPTVTEIIRIDVHSLKEQKKPNMYSIFWWDNFNGLCEHEFIKDWYLNRLNENKPLDLNSVWFLNSKTSQPSDLLLTYQSAEFQEFQFPGSHQELNGTTYDVEKDSLTGTMPYFILKNDSAGQPIYLKKKEFHDNTFNRLIYNLEKQSIDSLKQSESLFNNGITYFSSAIEKFDYEFLKPENRDFNKIYADGNAAIHHLNYINKNVIKHYLKYEANLNLQNKDGNTIIHLMLANYYFSERNQLKDLELLLISGADPTIANNKGLTPLKMIIYPEEVKFFHLMKKGFKYKEKLIELLIEYGAED